MKKIQFSRKWEEPIVATLFLIPALAFLGVYVVYSVLDAFHLSTLDWNGISPERLSVGLANWKALLVDQHFFNAIKHNLFIVVASIIVQMPIAIGIAFMIDRIGKKATPLKVIYYLPNLFSTAAVGMLFSFIFAARNGVFTVISQLFGGGKVDLLGHSSTALMGVFIVICWTAIPYYMMFYIAAFSTLPGEVYEAAVIDGVNLRQYFFRIALPMIKTSIKTAFTLSMIGSLKYFDLIFIMTEGGPNHGSELMATYMYTTTFRARQMGYGATIACGMFIVVVVFSLVFKFTTDKLLKGDD